MADVGDQISEKNVCLVIRGGKLTTKALTKAMALFLKDVKMAGSNQPAKGKQSVKQLVQQGQGVNNIEITSKNIKSFESVARKHGIDFAVKKDNTAAPPKWLVFFKAKDADALTAAFKEFTAKEAKRSAAKAKPSLIKNLRDFAEKMREQIVDKVKNKSRGGHTL